MNFDKENNIPDVVNGKKDKVDLHPKPLASYYYTKEIICPKLGISSFDVSNKNQELAKTWNEYLYNFPRERITPNWPRNSNVFFDRF